MQREIKVVFDCSDSANETVYVEFRMVILSCPNEMTCIVLKFK